MEVSYLQQCQYTVDGSLTLLSEIFSKPNPQTWSRSDLTLHFYILFLEIGRRVHLLRLPTLISWKSGEKLHFSAFLDEIHSYFYDQVCTSMLNMQCLGASWCVRSFSACQDRVRKKIFNYWLGNCLYKLDKARNKDCKVQTSYLVIV